jgi:hypothetical protein
VVRSGQLRWRVPLAAIQAVHPTRSPLSAPALSLDRLRVEYRVNGRQKQIVISPADRAGFYDSLVAAAPGLVKEGDRLRRRE